MDWKKVVMVSVLVAALVLLSIFGKDLPSGVLPSVTVALATVLGLMKSPVLPKDGEQ